MKAIRMILLSIFVILVDTSTAIMGVLLFSSNGASPSTVDVAWIILLTGILFALICGIYALASHRKAAACEELQKDLGLPIFFFKLALVPFFLLGTFLGIALMLANSLMTISLHLTSMGLILGAMTPFYLLALTVVSYLFILATSAFSISVMVIEYKKRTIKLPATIMFIMLQLVPVADVISYLPISLYFRSERKSRLASAGTLPINPAIAAAHPVGGSVVGSAAYSPSIQAGGLPVNPVGVPPGNPTTQPVNSVAGSPAAPTAPPVNTAGGLPVNPAHVPPNDLAATQLGNSAAIPPTNSAADRPSSL